MHGHVMDAMTATTSLKPLELILYECMRHETTTLSPACTNASILAAIKTHHRPVSRLTRLYNMSAPGVRRSYLQERTMQGIPGLGSTVKPSIDLNIRTVRSFVS